MKFLNVCEVPVDGLAKGEKNFSPSMTVPDMSLTVRDILERFVTGRSFDNLYREAFFSEEMEDIRGMDLVETTALSQDNVQNIIDLKEKLSKPVDSTPVPPVDSTPVPPVNNEIV